MLKTRRDFLSEVGRGMLVATVGSELAVELGLAARLEASETVKGLSFGELEPLVRLMQDTPAERLIPRLVSALKDGTSLRTLTQAAALANARTFGGEDYVGFHTMMALAPALHMSSELPSEQQALPVFKVLYRNTHRLQERGGHEHEVLQEVAPGGETKVTGEAIREAVRSKNLRLAEELFATSVQNSTEEAFNQLLYAVQDTTEVHRVVLPYRAWDLMGLIGKEQAHTLLRQSVRYCVQAEGRGGYMTESRSLLPKVLEEYKLLDRTPGSSVPDDAYVEQLSQTIFKSAAAEAARAMAAALAEGIAPTALGEALSLTANQLVLRDMGRRPSEEITGKPVGSVHGDSIGVHASDSANAWRNMARVSNTRNCYASLILGAWQVASDRVNRGGDFLNWQPLPVSYHLNQIQAKEAKDLLNETDEAIRGNLQARAAALVHRYGELGHPSRAVFDLLLKYAISEDGALHAEKFYRTVTEEFNSARAAFRWRYLVGLARVTASEYGRPAAGVAEARTLLKA